MLPSLVCKSAGIRSRSYCLISRTICERHSGCTFLHTNILGDCPCRRAALLCVAHRHSVLSQPTAISRKSPLDSGACSRRNGWFPSLPVYQQCDWKDKGYSTCPGFNTKTYSRQSWNIVSQVFFLTRAHDSLIKRSLVGPTAALNLGIFTPPFPKW